MNIVVQAAEVATMTATKVETMTVTIEAAVRESAEVERTLVQPVTSNTLKKITKKNDPNEKQEANGTTIMN